jgi:mannose-6-phosphate isomerase-like protein (cupin superfamily)
VITVVKYPQFAPASTCTPKGFSGDARKDTRPWGSYEVLLDEENVKVKKIVVKPFERLSLQLHRGRDEKWVIVQGLGLMHHNGEEYTVKEGHVVEILKYQTHRIENVSEQPLVFIEVQTGDCQEDDIIRIEDSYGRE